MPGLYGGIPVGDQLSVRTNRRIQRLGGCLRNGELVVFESDVKLLVQDYPYDLKCTVYLEYLSPGQYS